MSSTSSLDTSLPSDAAARFSRLLALEVARDPSALPGVIYSRAAVRSAVVLFHGTDIVTSEQARLETFSTLRRGESPPSDADLAAAVDCILDARSEPDVE